MDIDDAFICFSRSQHPPALLPSEASANGRGKVLLPGETTGNSLTTERSIAQHSCSSLAQSLQQPLGQSLRIIQQVLTSKSRANVDREHSKLSSEDVYIYIRRPWPSPRPGRRLGPPEVWILSFLNLCHAVDPVFLAPLPRPHCRQTPSQGHSNGSRAPHGRSNGFL